MNYFPQDKAKDIEVEGRYFEKNCCGNRSFIIDKQKIRHFKRFVKVFLSILVTPNIDYEIKF